MKSVEERLQELRADLTAATLLLEFLYVRVVNQHPKGPAAFEDLSKSIAEQVDKMTFPGVEAATADHLAQQLSESVTDLLENIRHRVKNPDSTARPAKSA
jgi:type VI protein secretion system component VasK